jgi:hypothetical protein
MTAPTTGQQLDQALAAADAAVSRISSGLLQLDGDPTRERLATTTLVGETARRWADANDTLSVLWACYQVVSDRVGEVNEHRKHGRLAPFQLAELQHALVDPTLELPAEIVATARRCLPGASVAERSSVEQLVSMMAPAFAGVAETVAQTSVVWDQVVPRLEQLDAALTEAERLATTAGVRPPNEVTAARRDLAGLQTQAAQDPLALQPDALESLAGRIDRVRAAVDEALATRSQLDGRLDGATRALEGAVAAIDAARLDHGEAAKKIAGTPAELPGLEQAAAETARLRTELGAIAGLVDTEWQVADRRLRALAEPLRELSQQTAAVTRAAGSGLATRRELRGRLDAYRAKAQAVGRGEDLELDRAYQAAHDALYVAPCDLDAAARLVVAYQKALSPSAPKDRP